MAVVVKIHEARVDYENADTFDVYEGLLQVFEGETLVGLHREWKYAAIKPSQCKRNKIAKLAQEILAVSSE